MRGMRILAGLGILFLGIATPGLSQGGPSEDSARTARILRDLRASLTALARAQHSYHRGHRIFAPSPLYLPEPPARPTVYILEATESGWSAMALHEEAPGIRCYIREGDAKPLTDGVDHKTHPGCLVAALPLLPPAPDSLGFDYSEEVSTTLPRQRDCHEVGNQIREGRQYRIDRYRRRQAFQGRAKLAFLVGADGEVEPSHFRVLNGSDGQAILDAMVLVVNCGYQPGVINGTAVRFSVQQQINFDER